MSTLHKLDQIYTITDCCLSAFCTWIPTTSLSSSTGIIQLLLDAISLDGLKKTEGEDMLQVQQLIQIYTITYCCLTFSALGS